jgi:hypothetical protein
MSEPVIGERRRAFYGSGGKDQTRIEGKVIAWTDQPSVLVEDDLGSREWWNVSLTEAVPVSLRKSLAEALAYDFEATDRVLAIIREEFAGAWTLTNGGYSVDTDVLAKFSARLWREA